MVLPDDLGEALRPQPVGQRPRRLGFKQRIHRRLIWANRRGFADSASHILPNPVERAATGTAAPAEYLGERGAQAASTPPSIAVIPSGRAR